METKRISLFPLPASVFYPKTVLPLHIFEPRYRDMVTHSIESGQWIGMVLLEPGYEKEYFGGPAIKPIGCAGNLEKWDRLEDGKYNILLRGQSRFRVVREVGDRPFREAEVELLPAINDRPYAENDPEMVRLMNTYQQFTELLPDTNPQIAELELSGSDTLGEVVDLLAYLLELPPHQQQQLVEEPDALKRHQTVMSHLQLKIAIVQQSKTLAKSGHDVRMN